MTALVHLRYAWANTPRLDSEPGGVERHVQRAVHLPPGRAPGRCDDHRVPYRKSYRGFLAFCRAVGNPPSRRSRSALPARASGRSATSARARPEATPSARSPRSSCCTTSSRCPTPRCASARPHATRRGSSARSSAGTRATARSPRTSPSATTRYASETASGQRACESWPPTAHARTRGSAPRCSSATRCGRCSARARPRGR